MTNYDIFQLVTLIAFLVVFIGRSTLLYFRHGLNPLVLGVGKAGFQRVLELSFVVGLIIWIIEILIAVFHWEWTIFGGAFTTTILDSVIAKISGMILIVIGFLIFVLALVAFGQSWRVGIDEQNPGDLITHGIFRISRNPIFLFIDLYFVGTFLINGSIFFLLIALVVVIGLDYQIRQEENFLKINYGEAYTHYFENVARYLTLRRR